MDIKKQKAIIVDIDGTIADVEHRRHHVAGKNRNWGAFFNEMVNDSPIQPVIDIAKAFYLHENIKYHILLCSGRPDNYKQHTIEWLANNDVLYDQLMMRKTGDNRSDVIVKKEMLEEIKKEFDVYFVIDDRQSVVNFWREEGLLCLQAAPGDFDELVVERTRKPNLFIMIGPAGAGKSTFIKNNDNLTPDMVISSDGLREQLCGDFRDQTKNDEVFAAMHDIARTRLKHGLDVVLDATHIRSKDRKDAVALGKEMDTTISYIVINRPLGEKIKTGDWRLDVDIKGKNLIKYHDEIFKSNLKDILNKDGFEDIILHDHRIQ